MATSPCRVKCGVRSTVAVMTQSLNVPGDRSASGGWAVGGGEDPVSAKQKPEKNDRSTG